MKDVVKDPLKVEQIIKSAQKEFVDQGFTRAKTETIAKNAGVSKGLIFHYYGSKANLYYETFVTTMEMITEKADLTVWTGAENLESMIKNALIYKMKLQIEYKTEFTLSMQAYTSLTELPELEQQKVADYIKKQMAEYVPMMSGPVIDRLNLRDGVTQEQVISLVGTVGSAVQDKAKVFLQQHPEATVADLQPIVDDAVALIEIIEHGALKPESDTK